MFVFVVSSPVKSANQVLSAYRACRVFIIWIQIIVVLEIVQEKPTVTENSKWNLLVLRKVL
jgi:hypothetical protein